ncbi:heme-binding protein [Leptolyngbya sp. CCY15150]|uniref:GlcG/HbpS family heme-binding protein n=1 Tax=Leptolyngbya sp. CCY15150 TaxID=2767772 RepID=UPI00194F5D62|nr:heme-binding protein [Leptolyngbya sp. CCY15150]
MYLRSTQELTHAAAQVILQGAIAKAESMGVPQCIAIVDAGGNLLAFLRMDGAKVLSQLSATQKAITAASSRVPTGGVPGDVELKLAFATGGQLTNLKGGLPIVIHGQVVGAIGVGSGTGDQDVEVGQAGLDALMAVLS